MICWLGQQRFVNVQKIMWIYIMFLCIGFLNMKIMWIYIMFLCIGFLIYICPAPCISLSEQSIHFQNYSIYIAWFIFLSHFELNNTTSLNLWINSKLLDILILSTEPYLFSHRPWPWSCQFSDRIFRKFGPCL